MHQNILNVNLFIVCKQINKLKSDCLLCQRLWISLFKSSPPPNILVKSYRLSPKIKPTSNRSTHDHKPFDSGEAKKHLKNGEKAKEQA